MTLYTCAPVGASSSRPGALGSGEEIALPDAVRAALIFHATVTPASARTTHYSADPDEPCLPPHVAKALYGWLGDRGVGVDPVTDGGLYDVDGPVFAAQFVAAYRALAGMAPESVRRNELGSYGLKHVVECAWGKAMPGGGVYITNGALILAALARGYPVWPQGDGINAVVCLAEGWRDTLHANLEGCAGAGDEE